MYYRWFCIYRNITEPLAGSTAAVTRVPIPRFPQDGRSRVLAHWAIYKVETASTEEAETARQVRKLKWTPTPTLGKLPCHPQVSCRLGLTPDISYSEIAEKAVQCGKKQLAILLLEHEVRADKQVLL